MVVLHHTSKCHPARFAMSENWTDEYRQLVSDCEARESRLTDWERTFIDSISKQLDNARPLSVKQIETLEAVWERATKKG